MIIIEICRKFVDSMKRQSFQILSMNIYKAFAENSSKALLLGNVRLGAFDYDAILFCENKITVFEFKAGWGQITVMPEGSWYKGKNKIWSGRDKQTGHVFDNPLVQMKIKRNVFFGYLRKYLSMKQYNIPCYVCFEREIAVTDSSNVLKDKVTWLSLKSIYNVTIPVLNDVLNAFGNEKVIEDWDELFALFRVKQSFSNGSTVLTPELIPDSNCNLIGRLWFSLKRIMHV